MIRSKKVQSVHLERSLVVDCDNGIRAASLADVLVGFGLNGNVFHFPFVLFFCFHQLAKCTE